ncbi:MAG: HAMP domain-containing histidine kinase [Lachnospiraceae bacterium]|nr:HAMP domain-containing histidine kinase [Lachnospiraceae bacterium]
MGGVVLSLIIYYFVDNVFNGMVGDWFMKNYFYEYTTTYDGVEMIVSEPRWLDIKLLILFLICVNVIFVICVLFTITHLYTGAKVKSTVSEISSEIKNYIQDGEKNSSLFPKEHSEIAAQIIEISSTMQRHEQLLKEESSRKNDLITYLAHDLKTPLTSVIGYLSLLEEIPGMPLEQRTKYINTTLDKAKRLEALINEFFDITRYNLQQIGLEKETIDLCYMMIQMTDEFYPILHEHGNTVDMSIDESITVYGDSVKLARVFNNILKNAVAYSYKDTVIKIWVEQTENSVDLYFENKGKTIPPHKLDSIFEKFFRLDDARSTNSGGAGLGLAIAKEIVTLHGGSITAKSENEATTFCVSLPINSSIHTKADNKISIVS